MIKKLFMSVAMALASLFAQSAEDSFIWKIYDSSHRVKDNNGNNYNGTMYLVCFGPTYAGYPSENQGPAYKYVITPFIANPGDGLDLNNMAQPGSEWPKVVKQVEVVDGLMTVDGAPVDGVTVNSDPAYWYRPIFFCPTRVQNPPPGYELDMWRCSFTATPKNMGRDGVYYFTHPKDYYYDVNHLKDSNISTYYYNSFAGPGKLREDDPEPEDAMLTAKLAWAQNFGPQGSGITGTGTFFARLEIACTNGSASTLSSVRFAFQDRVVELSSSTLLAAQLYDSTAPAGPISATETFGGETFRSLALDSALSKLKAAAKDEFVRVGPASVEGYVVKMEDRDGTPEMNSVSRGNPSTLEMLPVYADLPDYKKYCWLVWTSNGHTYALPISPVTGAGETSVGGIPVPAPKLLLKAASKLLTVAQNPVEVPSKNFYDSISIGLPINEGEVPSCRFTEFAVTEKAISGRIETAVGETKSIPPTASGFATVTLLGTDSLGEDFVPVSEVETDGDGRFTLTKPKDYAFFRIVISIGPMFIEK